MFRKPYIAFTLLLVLACGSSLVQAKRPNIVWIIADDHAAYVTGCYGNDKVRTPNIDRLATQGMRFDRAYCNAPVCTASRQSFLTGRYPRTIGVTLLRTPLPAAEVTIAETLKSAGYTTAAIGKMHFNSLLKHGFDVRKEKREFTQALRKRGVKPIPQGTKVLPIWKPFRDPAEIWLNGIYRPYGALDEDMWDTWWAQQAAAFIKEKRDQPFFLIASFTTPHSPFRFPVEYANKYNPDKMPVGKKGDEDDWQVPDIFRELTREQKQRITAAYYTSTQFMDKNVGLVLDALADAGLDDDTVVCYFGDHGYFLGQHGRFEKHASYEEAVRSPLIMRFPGMIQNKAVSNTFVEFVDLVPTMLEFAGVAIPDSVQGKSLVPHVSGKQLNHRNHVVVEYAQNEEAMIRNDRWKYVFMRGKKRRTDGYDPAGDLPGHVEQLFDLKNDPGEFKNVVKQVENAAIVKSLRASLVQHLRQTSRLPDLIPKSDDPLVILDHCVQPRDFKPTRNVPRGIPRPKPAK